MDAEALKQGTGVGGKVFECVLLQHVLGPARAPPAIGSQPDAVRCEPGDGGRVWGQG